MSLPAAPPSSSDHPLTAEAQRLTEDAARTKNWKRWGPYLAERQWGTVREDYSPWGDAWSSFSHDQSRSRAYRWGEDGLLGFGDRQGRLCFALALWNGQDPILKERLFGLTNQEGNHGEDVKECYYYLDATPTYSYAKALYKYPQREFPYDRLVAENAARGYADAPFTLLDAGAFDEDRYFDVTVEYVKASPDDTLIRITIANRGPEPACLCVLPTLWFRNTWTWRREGESYPAKPSLYKVDGHTVVAEHAALDPMRWQFDPAGGPSELLFTENETNTERLYGLPPETPYVKDAFHAYVVDARADAVNPQQRGTKAAALYRQVLPAGGELVLRLRLTAEGQLGGEAFGEAFDQVFALRQQEADAFYADRIPAAATVPERQVARQAYAGLLWSKQFYHYIVDHWLEGDPAYPPPPASRLRGRNHEWRHVHCRDVISMPDKWEYPWFAAWDLAFHMVPMATVDPAFAKDQLLLLLREWYLQPNGQMPAYEYNFSDVNPPVHAWAAWRVYRISAAQGKPDFVFLARIFHKLLLNFTWWVNRKDDEGNNLFSGGFLGLDNIGIFDRSQPLPGGGQLAQADGTAWMAFYASTMLAIALELAQFDISYDDVASKFFEHFVSIVDAMNAFGGPGLWDETDGFYYDQLRNGNHTTPLRTRSIVGIIPLFAVEVLSADRIAKVPGFKKRMDWFLRNRPDLARYISFASPPEHSFSGGHLLAVPSRERLTRVLRYVLDEQEFLSPYGVRALSRVHQEHPYALHLAGQNYRVDYVPGEATSGMFGGNSNWRGPVWFPVNYLLIEALQRYGHFYGDTLRVECPTGSGHWCTLGEVADAIAARLASLFLVSPDGHRPCHGKDPRYGESPHWRELILFHEYFHGEHGRGLGASHQTGWTALVVRCLEQVAQRRSAQDHR